MGVHRPRPRLTYGVCTAANPTTGTAEARGRRTLSSRRASSGRSAPRYAFNSVNRTRSSCAWLPPMRSSSSAIGSSASIAPPKSRLSNAANPRATAGTKVPGRVTPFIHKHLDLPRTRFERRCIARHHLRERNVHIGKCRPGARKRSVREVVHHSPRVGVARMPGQFPPPQKRHRIVQLAARRSAVDVRREGVPEQSGRGRRIASLEFAECLMPTQMAIQRTVARIAVQPRCQEAAGRVRIALLIAEMRARMRSPGVVQILPERSIDLRLCGSVLAVLRQRHAVMRGEPPIVAVVRGKPNQQVQQGAFLPGATGTADQAVGEGGGAEHHCVARPRIEVRGQRGQRTLGIACHQQVEERDMAGFPLGEAGGKAPGCCHRLACRRSVSAFQQRMRPGGMGEGKAGFGRDGTIERLERAWPHGQLRRAARHVGVPRGR